MSRSFQHTVWEHYRANGRDFPWRRSITPYRILVSEYMLQQTQTARVVPKFDSFIIQFPTIESLASANLSTVLEAWSGLGYYRRARYLHESAKVIVNDYHGEIPRDTDTLTLLPGVGENTAGAIRAYAFNLPSTFIETNIRRAILHHFFPDVQSVHDREVRAIVKCILDIENPREWYWALMDYGAYLPKIVTNPNIRSAHYHKQSPFVGSVRQVRGSILQTLVKERLISIHKLKNSTKGDTSHFDSALRSLVNENLVVVDDQHVMLP